MANNIVRLPLGYFADPTKGRPVFNGSVFIGNPDTDPEILGNRKTVTLRQEDGTEVPISGPGQPLLTGSGGVILYNGSPVQVLTDGNYSIKVLNSSGAQVYFIENALDGEPITTDSTIAVKNFATLALAVADTSLVDGDTLDLAERTTGNGGGDTWDVVLSSTVTENTFNIVQAVGVGTLSLVLRYDGVVNIKAWGAVGDGTTDDSPAIQSALDAAKGADATGVGRSVFSIYFPHPTDFYRIVTTLVIDGTHGLLIYSDGALTARSSADSETVLRWDGATSLPLLQVRGETVAVSNPNFSIKLRDISIAGNTTKLDQTATPPSDIALAGIYIGNLSGVTGNTLTRQLILENVEITDCRFGAYSDAPDAQNTDHAKIIIKNSRIHNNAEQGIHWGTGNAVATVDACFVEANGWGADHYPADVYSAEIGANIYVKSGYMDVTSYTSSGKGISKPIDADIYQGAGRVNIAGAWSDVHGFFFYQTGGGSNIVPGALSGIRHFEGSMDGTNTPDSIRFVNPGMSLQSSGVFGNVNLESGQSGRSVCLGVNFLRAGATFTGTGVDTQRSIINIGNLGNNAQILTGGADAGVDLAHLGVLAPQYLQMGVHSSGDSQTMALMQALGGASSDSGFTEFFDAATGSKVLIMNGYLSSNSPFTITPMATGNVYYITIGQGVAFQVRQLYSSDGSTPLLLSAFIAAFEIRNGTGSSSNQIAISFPLRDADPTFTSGDFWKGCVYYNKTTNKFRGNVGASTWNDMN